MNNRLELNWKLDGFVDEQRYYCSETTIDPENLPVPKAVLAGDVLTYIDTDIEVGKNYCVRIGAVKNGTEKLSVEKMVSAGDLHWGNVISLLHLDSNLIDQKSVIAWSAISQGFSVSGKFDQCANFSENTSNTIKSSYSPSIEPLAEDFTIELFLNLKRKSALNEWMGVFGKQVEDSTRTFALLVNENSSRLVAVVRSTADVDYVLTAETEIDINQWVHVALVKDASKFRMFIDGMLAGEVSLPGSMSVKTNSYGITLGSIYFTSNNYPLSGYIDEFRYTKNAARYTGNFTPPIQEFPNF